MTNKTNILTRWQLERKIPLGIIIAIILQTLTAIWWAAKLDTRLVMQEEWFQKTTFGRKSFSAGRADYRPSRRNQ